MINKKKVRINNEIKLILDKLKSILVMEGYSEFCGNFNPLAPRIKKWIENKDNAPETLRPMIELWLLGDEVTKESAIKSMGNITDELINVGMLTLYDNGEKLRTHNLVLYPIMGIWLFFQKPAINPKLYFGDDSVALLTRLQPKGRVLDLCSGPGIQALFSSNYATSVDAVEINPIAAEINKFNVLLNNRDHLISVYCGNLFEPIGNNYYDFISANPPLLPFPENEFYPFVGHGGEDGMEVVWQILDGLDKHLTEDGYAQIICTTLSDGILPQCTQTLDNWAKENKMSVIMSITSHHKLEEGSHYFDGLTLTASLSSGVPMEIVRASYKEMLRKRAATHLCSAYLFINRRDNGLKIMDVTHDEINGLWYI